MTRPRRDADLVDALEKRGAGPFSGTRWRVVRDGRDPCACAASGGRWDDGTFDVLYTSRERDGALAELYFHLSRGQPVFPSQLRYFLYELHVDGEALVDLSDRVWLASLGVDMARFGQLSYVERAGEYPRTQDIADVAHFLDYDGLVVPSARRNADNLVLFCDQLRPDALGVVKNHGLVDWKAWAAANP